nr:hypothetical protein BaRGS_034614 [Batillaria attramentaria]
MTSNKREIVDTPGFCDTDPTRTDEDIAKVITEFLVGLSPGPHAVLIVINGSQRFKNDDHQAYQEAKKLLGEKLANRVILVFTGADNLEKDKLDISEELKKVPKLEKIVKDESKRFCSINNNYQE